MQCFVRLIMYDHCRYKYQDGSFRITLDCFWTHVCANPKPEPTFLSASDFVISTFRSLIQDKGASSGIKTIAHSVLYINHSLAHLQEMGCIGIAVVSYIADHYCLRIYFQLSYFQSVV